MPSGELCLFLVLTLLTYSNSFSQISTFPYAESFEVGLADWTNVGGDDFDWTDDCCGTPSVNTGPAIASDGTFYVYTEASDPNFPSMEAYIQATFDFTSVVSPEFSFFYHMFGGNMGSLHLDVNDGSWNLDIWSISGQQHTSDTQDWIKGTVDLSAFAGQNNIILRFRGLTGSGFTSDMAFDNISCIDYCSVTSGNAAISVTTICNAGGGIVDLSLTGQDAGTTLQWQQSTDGINFTDIAGATTANYTTATLSSTQLYYFRCTVTNGCSVYSDTVFVNVAATNGTINTYPYTENFDVSLGLWSNVGGDDFDWTQDCCGTLSNGTGPTDDNGGGGSYVYTEASDPNFPNKSTFLQLTFDFTGINNPELAFFYHMFGAAMGTLNVDINGDNAVWSRSGQQQGAQGDSYTKATVDLSNYAGLCNVIIRFRGVTGSTWQSDIAIDDVSVYDCGVNAGSASISVGAICNTSGDSVDLVVSGHSIGATIQWQQSTDGVNFSDIAGGTAANFTTAILPPTNVYYFRAGVTNGCTRYSDTVTVYVTTSAGTIVPPYSESFEAGFGSWNNIGGDNFDWSRLSGATPSADTGPASADDGSFYIYTEASDPNNPAQSAFLELSFDFTGLADPSFSFSYHMFGGTMGTLYLDVNGITIWSVTGQQQSAENDPWTQVDLDLTAFANTCNVTVQFRGVTGLTFQSDIAVDNISCTNTCTVTPGTATVSPEAICTPGGGSANLALSGHDSGTTLQWQQSTDGINYSNMAGDTTSNFTTPTLTPTQVYYFRCAVTNSCTSYSDTAQVSVGTGGGTINTFPYTENFDVSLGSWNNPVGDDFDWTRNLGGTPSVGTGPTDDNGGGGSYVYTEASDPNNPGKTAFLDATADFTSLTTPQISFYYHMFGPAMGTLYVEANGTQVWSITGGQQAAQGDAYIQVKVDLSAYAGDCLVNLRIGGVTGGTWESDVAIDDVQICDAPMTSALTGPDSVCTNDPAVYSVVNTPGNTYAWVISGGTINSGQGLNSIGVTWAAVGSVGSVKVEESNLCIAADTVQMAINIHGIVPDSIIGDTNVQEFAQNVSYTVPFNTGYTYTWSVAGGVIDLGQGTNTITVDWNGPGPIAGNVSVIANSGACGAAAPVALAVTISGYIVSAQNGTWNVGSTWSGGTAPTSIGEVRIAPGHTVTLAANETINNLVIDAGGTIDNADFSLTVDGDYTLNGRHTGNNSSSARILLQGGGTNLDGTGTLDSIGQVRIISDMTIMPTADLSFSETQINMYTGVTVTNNGSLVLGGGIFRVTGAPIWTNATNSTLRVTGDLLLTNSTLNASASGNTISYNGSGNQTIKTPSSNYANLIISTGGIKTLQGNVDINENLDISAATLDVTSSNFNLNLGGNWSNIGGSFMARSATVTFDGTGTQTCTNSAGETFHHLVIATGTTLQPGGAPDSINLSGNWTNNGTFVQQTGTVNFNGTNAQTITGSAKTTFSNLTIDNAAGVSLGAATDLEQTLTLTSGIFNTNGNDFTLLSTASGTARIGEITGGDITGDIIMQRYIDAGTTGYHFITPPVSGASLGDWDQEMILSIPDGDNGLACSGNWCFWSVKYYNEAVAGVNGLGYDSLGTVGAALGIGTGYWVYTGTGAVTTVPFTFDTRGPANKNAISLPVTYNNSGLSNDDGWNLVGNPYPSTIDWDAIGWTKAGLADAVYLWDPDADVYTSYVGGSGSNGGTQFIPSSQAFWVKATAAPTLAVSESVKTSTDQAYLKQSSIYSGDLKLNISGAGYKDETVIKFANTATDAFDVDWDAYKLTGGKSAPYIATVVGDSVDLSINSLSELAGDTIIPIRINVPSFGLYSLYVEEANDLPQEYCILLEDTLFNTMTDMRTDTAIVGVSPLIDPSPRFRLHISAPLITNEIQISCNGANDGLLIANTSGIANYIWLDSNGDTLRNVTGVNGPDTLSSLAPGNYSVIVSSQSMTVCSEIIESFEIVEPDNLTLNGQITNPVCFGDTDGEIDMTIAGGTPPFSYSWNSGQTSEDLVNLGVGAYEVTIQDSNGCTIVQSYQISTPSALTSSVTVKDETCYGESDGVIELNTNGGSGAYQYSWSNGASGPENQNLAPGAYNVTITDAYGCNEEQTGIIIEAGPQVIAGYTVPTSTVYLDDGGSLQFTNISVGGAQYVWDFGNGQSSTQTNPIYTFVAPGNYDVTLTAINGVCSSTSSNIISVSASVGIEGNDSHTSGFEAFEADGLLNMYFGSPASNNVDIHIHNILGQLVCSYSDLKVGNQHVALNIKHFRSGVYIVRVINGDINQTQKFTIK